MNGCKFVVVRLDTHAFQIRFDELEKRITPHTQALIVNSPNNPSGVVYNRCRRFRSWRSCSTERAARSAIPSTSSPDEPIASWSYDGVDVPYLPDIYPNTIIYYSIQNPLYCPASASAMSACRTLRRTAPSCSPPLPAPPHGRPRLRASLQQKVIAQCVDVAQSGGL